MKQTLNLLTAIVAVTVAANVAQAQIILDNYIGQQNGAESGAVGNFQVQSFTPNVAGLGALDTVTANSPLPSIVYLNSATFLRAITGTNVAAGQSFIDVYLGAGNGGTYIGSSLNSFDVNGAASLSPLTWNFGGLALDSTLQYAFVFSSDSIAGSPQQVRLQVARDAGGAFASSYAGGTADFDPDNSSPLAFETRFSVAMSTVPEPASVAILGLGIASLVIFRRRKV